MTSGEIGKRGTTSLITGLVIAFALLAILLPIPRALGVSNQPWVAELCISLILLIGLGWTAVSGPGLPSPPTGAHRTLILMGVFLAWGLLSALWAYSSWAALHFGAEWSIYFAVVVIASTVLRRQHGYRSIVYGLGLASIILALNCIIDLASTGTFDSGAEGTLRIRYGKFGEMAALVSPFLAGVTFYARTNKSKLLAAIPWLSSWLLVMLSLSKGAFLAGIVGHLVCFAGIFFFGRGVKKRAALTPATVWLVVTVGVQILFSQATSIPATTDYITGSADKTRSTSEMRLFTWSTAWLLVKQHPLVGVGGDNFGIRFNEARAARPRATASSPEIAEDYVVERAHNEPLQILAEIGVVGFLLFAVIFVPFKLDVIRSFVRRRQRLTPILWASIGGMLAFAFSSMVSSFSFRVVQNGVAFFLIFSIALNETAKLAKTDEKRSDKLSRAWLVVPIVLVILCLSYFGANGVAEQVAKRAERSDDADQARRLYETSLAIDPDNGNARYFYSSLLYGVKEPSLAASELRKAIDHDLGVSVTYAQLAKYQDEAGDREAADGTFREALAIFPNSVYLRVAHACFLEKIGHQDQAAAEMAYARKIDPGQANGWHIMITKGSVAAYSKAQQDATFTAPADLLPSNAVPQYVDDPMNPRQSEATP